MCICQVKLDTEKHHSFRHQFGFVLNWAFIAQSGSWSLVIIVIAHLSNSIGTSSEVTRPKSRNNSSLTNRLILQLWHYLLRFLLETLNEECYNERIVNLTATLYHKGAQTGISSISICDDDDLSNILPLWDVLPQKAIDAFSGTALPWEYRSEM